VPIYDKICVICEPSGFEFAKNKPKIERSEIPTARRDKANFDQPNHEKTKRTQIADSRHSESPLRGEESIKIALP
jgi:hypothetical protein